MKTVYIDGPIGQQPGELSAKWLRSQLPTDGKNVVLQVHSEGGSVFEAMAMIDILNAYAGHKTAIVSSMALSAASMLLSACDEVEVTSNSYVMLHNSHMEDAAELTSSERQLLASLNERMVQLYAGRSGRSPREVRQMMATETWLNADEAVRSGFADRIADASSLRIVARAVPKKIVAKAKPKTSAVARWRAAVDTKAATMPKAAAIMAVDKSHPGLRLKMLAEVNKR